MIRGIGVDIIEIDRIGRAIADSNGGFASKVFTDAETEYCRGKSNPAQHYAARFAAKEALSKALAIGLSEGFRWKDAEVQNETSGVPRIAVFGSLASLVADATVHLSISHSDSHVVAMVIIEDLPR
jgi:holo-[acyl-carrier protein] synthase